MHSSRESGFSVPEVLVSVGIMVMLAILIFMKQMRSLSPEQTLASAQDSTRSLLVLARSYALNGKLCCGNQLPNGYGLVITLDGHPDNVISLYADLDGTNTYTSSDAVVAKEILIYPVDVVSCQDTARTISTGTCDFLFSATGDRNIYFSENSSSATLLSGTFTLTVNHNTKNQQATVNVYGFGIIE